jgi:hypothetical protein
MRFVLSKTRRINIMERIDCSSHLHISAETALYRARTEAKPHLWMKAGQRRQAPTVLADRVGERLEGRLG